MKKLMIICLVLALFMGMSLSAQFGGDQAEAPGTMMNFEHLAISGKIIDNEGKPVPNVLVKIRLVPEDVLKRELNVSGAKLTEIVVALTSMVGTSEFLRKNSDENGAYTFKGVMKPGVYYIEVKNNDNYLPAKLKVNIEATGSKKFEAPNLILSIRKGPALSKKTRKKLEKAQEAFKKGKKDEAFKLYKAVLEMEPKYAEAHYNLGILLRGNKKIVEAISHFEEAVKLQEDYTVAMNAVGETLYALKKYEDAAKYYTMYLETLKKGKKEFSKDDIEVVKILANCYRGLNQMDKANGYLAKYVKLKFEQKPLVKTEAKLDAKLAAMLGGFYYGKKDMANAVELYKIAISTDPEIGAEAYLYLGNSYFFVKDFKSAVKVFNMYLERYPNAKDAAKIKTFKENIEKGLPKEK
ncbi:MAG: tetratricopeptide repeat protein [bacterium]|nr:tetratricopeptide repeat protein [bacterium]